jgi:hypothetical protein
MAIEAGGFFSDILQKFLVHCGRKVPRRQHTFNDGRRQPGVLVAGLQNIPSGAPTKAKHLRLFI